MNGEIVKDVKLPLQKQAQGGGTHEYFQYISIQSVSTARICGGLMRIRLRYTHCVSCNNRPEWIKMSYHRQTKTGYLNVTFE